MEGLFLWERGWHSRACEHPLILISTWKPVPEPSTTTAKTALHLLLGLLGTGSQQEMGTSSPLPPTAKRAKSTSAPCLLPALLLFSSKFSCCGFYLLLYTFFFLSVSDQVPVSGDSKMT